jgi:exodeoxyribonuclease V
MNNDDVRDWLLWADRIVCATNETRRQINRRMLGYLGLGPYPRGKGERLICLHNYWGAELLNGMAVRLEEIEDDRHPLYFTARVLRDEGDDRWVSCGQRKIYRGHFEFTAKRLARRQATEQLQLDYSDIRQMGLIEIDWAWCTTVHKAQGSEWDKVLVITETWPTKKDERDRMIYTAVTRAAKELRIIGYWDLR